MLTTVVKTTLLLSLCALLAACGWAERLGNATRSTAQQAFFRPLTTLHLELSARPASNTDAAHMGALATPTLVRVYQLADARRFEQASYEQLLDHSEPVLGADRLEERALVVKPGEGRQLDVPLAEQARFIGVVALFRQAEGPPAQWRLLLPREQLQRQLPRRLVLSDNHLALLPLEEG
ncbi:type VI secretion system lipoprotein TssJ [Pseudomonas sp. NPDC007930]|uniref:type VI secretion system lipoprotein TssJ n=1 Tax=Pseudomonas sp. NPDC007930 TaxID=3364417 RepID=UPI0036E6E960